MVDGHDRTVRAEDAPVAEAYPMVLRPPLVSDLPAREEREVDEALARYQEAIDREIADRLGRDGALRERLARVRPGSDVAPEPAGEALVGYAHTAVALWLRLVLAGDRSPVGLAERAIEAIATETVARALVGLGARTDSTVALLARCAEQLPGAYRAWRLRAGVLNASELAESLAEGDGFRAALLRGLAEPVWGRKLMGDWGYAARDVDDLIANTRTALSARGERR